MPQAILLHQDPANKVSASVVDISDAEFPQSEVTLRIEHSSLNYKDALAIVHGEPVVRTWPHGAGHQRRWGGRAQLASFVRCR